MKCVGSLMHSLYFLITTILISSYYHHAQDEQIDTRRFGLSTIAHLEGCVTRATVIILYSLTSEFWKEVQWLNLGDPLQHQPLAQSLSSESDLMS